MIFSHKIFLSYPPNRHKYYYYTPPYLESPVSSIGHLTHRVNEYPKPPCPSTCISNQSDRIEHIVGVSYKDRPFSSLIPHL